MKYLNIIIVTTIFLLSGITTELNAQKEGIDQFTVQVDGLGCPFCAYGLEKKIKKLKGLKKLKIDMEDGMMTFNYPSEKELTLKSIESLVDEAGYTAVSTSVVRSDGTSDKIEFEISDKIVQSRVVKASIFVAGVCGMCRSRIKKVTRNIEGVVESDWDEDTKILTISFDKELTNEAAIEAAVAAAGHDTKNVKASDDSYEGLPACCQYERVHN